MDTRTLLTKILIANPRIANALIEQESGHWFKPSLERWVENGELDLEQFCGALFVIRDLAVINKEQMKKLLKWLDQPEQKYKYARIAGFVRLADQLNRQDLQMDLEMALKFAAGSYLNLPCQTIVEVDLANVILSACLDNCKIEHTILDDACLEGCSFVDGVILNSRCEDVNFTLTNFTDAEIVGSNFTGSIFKRARLINVDIVDSNFELVDFTNANLIGAKFYPNTKLKGAVFKGADFVDFGELMEDGVDLPEIKERVQNMLNTFDWVVSHPQKADLQQAILASIEEQANLFSIEIKQEILRLANVHPFFTKEDPSMKLAKFASSPMLLLSNHNAAEQEVNIEDEAKVLGM